MCLARDPRRGHRRGGQPRSNNLHNAAIACGRLPALLDTATGWATFTCFQRDAWAPASVAFRRRFVGVNAKMESLDYWRLCEEFTVVQAALLIVGADPTRSQNINQWDQLPLGYEAAKTALLNAIGSKRLPAEIVYYTFEESGAFRYSLDDEINWDRTTITVEAIQKWLRTKGFATGFFFPTPETTPDYLSQSHDNYSSKLAAAIEAWKAVSIDAELKRGKTVKQALIVWLRQHANEFGLTKDDGKPNEQGIEEIAKIANWDIKGGAPKTPGSE
jgi:hypothetical protein